MGRWGMSNQGYIADDAGARRITRDKQLHIRVTEDQLARFQLAAESAGVSVSRWAVDLMSAAAQPARKRVK